MELYCKNAKKERLKIEHEIFNKKVFKQARKKKMQS